MNHKSPIKGIIDALASLDLMYNAITLGLMTATAIAIMMALSTNTAFSIPSTNVTTSASNLTLATPIYQQHSQTHGDRVIDVTNRTANLEVSYSGNGFAKSISAKSSAVQVWQQK